jgi:alkylation response protein AidB-like acyl-CoA dehydrogenase
MDRTVVDAARHLADTVLFPGALDADRSPVVPADRLDALAAGGFYGVFAPVEAGGLGADPATVHAVVEALAGGCLTTTFVWLQHLGAVGAALSGPAPLRGAWLTSLATGRVRSGVAFAHLRRPGPPAVTARPATGGWLVRGTAPWVTGWSRIDVVHVAARHGDDVVWLLVDAVESPTLVTRRLALAALDATATVEMALHDHAVPADRVTAVQPLAEWLERDALGLRTNGSLALGVAGRCCRLLGASPLDEQLAATRTALDTASPEALPTARARATELAHRAAGALAARGGGRSLLRDQHAQRLAREALFLLVQGQTPAIRDAQLHLLSAAPMFP